MTVTPVQKHIARYPTKEQADLNRMLLRHKPAWWTTSGAALLLLALAGTSLTGCDTKTIDQPLDGDVVARMEYRKMTMAPLYIPPNGGNNTGSEAGTPKTSSPLTDETAYAIVESEIKNLALELACSKFGERITVSREGNGTFWNYDFSISHAKAPIRVEYLAFPEQESDRELAERQAIELPENPREAASALWEVLSESESAVYEPNKETIGVIFYADETAVSQEEHLRAQVADFVQWLKTNNFV
jgi:hypothetical protein